MPLRTLLRYLASNEQLVQKIAESYPIRRAAQLVVSVFFRGKQKLEEVDQRKVSRLMTFIRKFQQNMKEGIEDAKKQIKK